MRKLLLVTPTNHSPLLCPRGNDLPHRAKTLPHCTRIFYWSVELRRVSVTKPFNAEMRRRFPTVHSWRQTAFCKVFQWNLAPGTAPVSQRV